MVPSDRAPIQSAVVVIPTYNERDNIDLLIGDLLALPFGLHVIVVDDNSPDGTGAAVDAWAAREPRVKAIHRPQKLGLGTAHIAAFRQALAAEYDAILTMDADFSHHPTYLPAMLAQAASADVVIGSRYVPGGGTLKCTVPRRALSRAANLIARLLLGLHATDCTAGFRCYRRAVLESIDLATIFANGYSFLIEMLYRAQRRGWQVREVPIVFEDRRFGTSKISKHEVTRALQTVVRLFGSRLREALRVS